MRTKQRVTFNDLTQTMHDKRITRRSFLERTAGIGLASSAMVPFLESCSSTISTPNVSATKTTRNTGRIDIYWESEHDAVGTYKQLVQAFNMINNHNINVTHVDTSSDQQHDDLITKLQHRQGNPDIISMDIIWTDEFARKGWVTPIDDRWPATERKNYLPTPIDGVTSQGHLWAAPFRTDVGLLYYRSDLIAIPPTTWEDLFDMAQQTNANVANGYVWQGKQYEGLVCNFVEVLTSFGGSILDPQDPTRVVVNSDAAHQALSEMKSWIGTISPSDIQLYDEDMSDDTWSSGNAMFMRNWPTYIAQSNDTSRSKIAQKFGVTSLPGNTRSCLGGWNLGINAFSKQQDAAWEFIHWMLQEDAQQVAAIDASFSVTLKSIYNDPYVHDQNPLYEKLPAIIERAQLRPKSPKYPDITQAIQKAVYSTLTGSADIDAALTSLQNTLKGLV